MASLAEPRPLSQVVGGRYTCTAIRVSADEDSLRLRRFGICPTRTVELIEVGDPLIVRMGRTKVGISRQLAAAVLVTEAELISEVQ